MGYFPNGTSGDMYERKYCDKCIHREGPDGESGCAVMLAHILCNYKECNNEESILHMLIPKNKEGFNEKCLMFHEGDAVLAPKRYTEKEIDPQYRDWARAKGLI